MTVSLKSGISAAVLTVFALSLAPAAARAAPHVPQLEFELP